MKEVFDYTVNFAVDIPVVAEGVSEARERLDNVVDRLLGLLRDQRYDCRAEVKDYECERRGVNYE